MTELSNELSDQQPLPEGGRAIQMQDLNAQTAVIAWRDLQRYFATGSVIYVASDLDLVAVAYQVALDNKSQVARWMEAGVITPVSDQQAQDWIETDALVWSVVVKPWVLVQLRLPAPV